MGRAYIKDPNSDRPQDAIPFQDSGALQLIAKDSQYLQSSVILGRGKQIVEIGSDNRRHNLAGFVTIVLASEYTGGRAAFGVIYTSTEIQNKQSLVDFVDTSRVIWTDDNQYFYHNGTQWEIFSPLGKVTEAQYSDIYQHFVGGSASRPVFNISGQADKFMVASLADIPAVGNLDPSLSGYWADAAAVYSAISGEVYRATQAEGTLDGSISGEVYRATQAEGTIDGKISGEIYRAKTTEGNLASLTTTASGNLVEAINEVKGYALASHTWLPAVTSVSGLSNPVPDTTLNYLCRVISDPTASNIGVWERVAGASSSWTYFGSNQDFVDELELAGELSGYLQKVVVTGSGAKVTVVSGAVTALADLQSTDIPNLSTNKINSGVFDAARMPAFTGDVTTVSGSVETKISANAVVSGMIANKNVTYAKIQDMAANTVLGAVTAGTPAEITVATLQKADLENTTGGNAISGLTIGITGTLGYDHGGTGLTSAAKGQLLVGTGTTSGYAALTVAATDDGKVLTAKSTATNGVEWAFPPLTIKKFWGDPDGKVANIILNRAATVTASSFSIWDQETGDNIANIVLAGTADGDTYTLTIPDAAGKTIADVGIGIA